MIRLAQLHLEACHQGNRPFADYFSEFCRWADMSQLDNITLRRLLINGLTGELKSSRRIFSPEQVEPEDWKEMGGYLERADRRCRDRRSQPPRDRHIRPSSTAAQGYPPSSTAAQGSPPSVVSGHPAGASPPVARARAYASGADPRDTTRRSSPQAPPKEQSKKRSRP